MTAAVATEPRAGCPKRMVFGPCGGVQVGGRCESGGAPCPFVTADGVAAGPPPRAPTVPARHVRGPAAAELLALMDDRAVVVADLPSPGPQADTERALAAALAGSVDAALLGDAPWARLQLPPAARAALVAAEGLRPWSGVNCRDRNRVALEAELSALEAGGVGAIHCVTGDHPSLGDRPDAEAVFDLDSTRLASLAAARSGAIVSVAESPATPPTAGRAARAAAKARAGADLCFVNHAGSPAEVAAFVAELHELAPEMRLVACVPLVTSHAAADRIARYLHGPLPSALLAPLAARNPVANAIALAVETAEVLLAIPGIGGVDLSAPAGPGEHEQVAVALAEAGRALGAGA